MDKLCCGTGLIAQTSCARVFHAIGLLSYYRSDAAESRCAASELNEKIGTWVNEGGAGSEVNR